MKIIAHTEVASYGDPVKLLVEISLEELEKLTGTRSDYDKRRETYKIGKKLDVGKAWDFNWTFRTLFNNRDQLVGAFRKVLDDVEKIELPTLEATTKGDK